MDAVDPKAGVVPVVLAPNGFAADAVDPKAGVVPAVLAPKGVKDVEGVVVPKGVEVDVAG